METLFNEFPLSYINHFLRQLSTFIEMSAFIEMSGLLRLTLYYDVRVDENAAEMK